MFTYACIMHIYRYNYVNLRCIINSDVNLCLFMSKELINGLFDVKMCIETAQETTKMSKKTKKTETGKSKKDLIKELNTQEDTFESINKWFDNTPDIIVQGYYLDKREKIESKWQSFGTFAYYINVVNKVYSDGSEESIDIDNCSFVTGNKKHHKIFDMLEENDMVQIYLRVPDDKTKGYIIEYIGD